MTSWLIRHRYFIFLPRIKEFWKTLSFPGTFTVHPQPPIFCSGLKTGCCRGQGSNVYMKFDCCLEYSCNFVELHRKIAWYCGQLIKLLIFGLIVQCHLRLVANAFKGSFMIWRKKVTFLHFSGELCPCYSCCCGIRSDKTQKVAYTFLGILML